MKFLTFLLFAWTINSGNNITISEESVLPSEPIVHVEIQHHDGSMSESNFTVSEFLKANFDDALMFSCTYVTTSGQCRSTAETCAAAKAMMLACLAEQV